MCLMTEESYFHTLAHTFNQQLAPWRAILLAFLLFYFPKCRDIPAFTGKTPGTKAKFKWTYHYQPAGARVC